MKLTLQSGQWHCLSVVVTLVCKTLQQKFNSPPVKTVYEHNSKKKFARPTSEGSVAEIQLIDLRNSVCCWETKETWLSQECYHLNIDSDVKIDFGLPCVRPYFHSHHLFLLSLDHPSVPRPPPHDIGSSVISYLCDKPAWLTGILIGRIKGGRERLTRSLATWWMCFTGLRATEVLQQ